MLLGSKAALIAVVLAAAPAAFSGPRISIGDPPTGTPVGLNFGFTANENGGGFLSFQNVSGFDWKSLNFKATAAPDAGITCDPGVFDACNVSPLSSQGSGETLFSILFESFERPAIANKEFFTIDLNDFIDRPNTDPNGVGQWDPNVEFQATANAVPEPAYASALVVLGLLATCGSRYRRSLLRRRA